MLFAIAPAQAQSNSELIQRLERQQRQIEREHRLIVHPNQPVGERLLLDYGITARYGLYGIDDQFGSTHILRQSDVSLTMFGELDGTHQFFGQLRFFYNDFNSGDQFGTFGSSSEGLEQPIGDQYWYSFNLRGAETAKTGHASLNNLTTKVGRQMVHWGSGLALSTDLYAALVDLEFGPWGLTGVAGSTPSSSTVDFDGSRPNFDVNTRRAFFGLSLEHRGGTDHHPYMSYLIQRDHSVETIAGAVPTTYSYDSEYLSFGSHGSLSGQWLYRAEVVHEDGRGLSSSIDNNGNSIAQTPERIDAWAGIVTLTYLPRDEKRTRWEWELITGSGDPDRLNASDTIGGNASGTPDEAFNSLGYVNTGLALAPDPANLVSVRMGWSQWVDPQANTARLGINGFVFAKMDKNAAVSFNSNSHSLIGGEVDVFAEWRLASDLTLSTYYGVFVPGDAMPAGEDGIRHFAYIGVTYGF
jgi:hypothetical protein